MRRAVILTSLLALSAAASLSACRDEVRPAATDAGTQPSPTVVTVTSTRSDNTDYMGTMFSRMSNEAASRPGATPTVESVLAAFAAGGLPVQPGRQVLAAMVHARYCWQSTSADQALGFSVCEYESEEAAKAGAEWVRVQGAAFGERTILINGKTTLTMKGPAEVVAKARSLFEAAR